MLKKNNIVDFTWGRVIRVHNIGEYSIVEYHPFKNNPFHSISKVDTSKNFFHPYIENGERDTSETYFSLDAAMAAAIAYKIEGPNHRADRYFIAGMNAIAEKRSKINE